VRVAHFEAVAGARADDLRYDDLALVNANTAPATGFTRTAVPGHTVGAISPRVALRFDLGSRLALRAASGDGFRGPYLNELVRGFNVGKIVMAPNPSLTPERSRTDSAGLDYLIGAGRLAFDAVQIRVRDAIAYATLSPTLMQQSNLDRTQTESYTLSYAAPLGACSRVRVSGTTQRPLISSGPPGTAGMQLAYVPSRSADIGIDAAGHGPLGFSFDGSYVGQTYADNAQQQPLGAALLFGATVRATTVAGTTFALVADNLTRQAYLSSIDRYGPPQTIALRIGIPLGGAPRASGACG
jgi:outer membrane receptor protein involved in Fe transport